MNYDLHDENEMKMASNIRSEVAVDINGHVESFLEMQEMLLNKLDEAIVRLHGKIAIITNNLPTSSPVGDETPTVPPVSVVAERIWVRNNHLISLIERVQRMYESVDL